MTRQEIQKKLSEKQFGQVDIPFWLREIASQLACINEREEKREKARKA